MWNQFDIVRIVSTQRVQYLSAPSGDVVSPHGNWSIVGFMGGDAVLAKDQALIRIPINDVKKVAIYDPDWFYKQLKLTNNKKLFNVVQIVSEELGINTEQAKEILLTHNMPFKVNSNNECGKILRLIIKIYGEADVNTRTEE